MLKIKLFGIFILFFLMSEAQNQKKLDSLHTVLSNSIEDSLKAEILYNVAEELEDFYPDSSKKIYLQIVDDYKKINQKYEGLSLRKLGYLSFNEGNYPVALEYCISSLKIFEHLEMINEQAYLARQLGQINHYQSPETFGEAYKWYQKAISLLSKIDNKLGLARVQRDIGSLLSDPISQDFYNRDSAMFYFNKAFEVIKVMGEPVEIAGFNLNIAWMLAESEKYDDALNRINESFEYYNSINHPQGILSCTRSKAYLNGLMGNYDLSEKLYLSAIVLADSLKNIDAVNNMYESLSHIKSEQKDYKKSLEYYRLSVEAKFKLYSQDRINAMTEMKTKYETEKKELQIENLNKENELQNEVVEKQMILIYSFILGFVIVLVFSVIITRQYSQKKKANLKLAQQNEEIRQQKEEITSQRDEITAQRDEIEAQRDEISKHRDLVLLQKEEIEDSINYAKRIQNAVLPDIQNMQMILGEHFILFRPKDIVSGDFYWATIFKQWQIFTVADCTGHGVPGAFMSMLGISFLNEIVRKEEVTQASQILNLLRKRIIESLKQKGVAGEQKDGMDISLCVLDLETQKFQFAGANNPLYIVKSEKLKVKNEDVIAIRQLAEKQSQNVILNDSEESKLDKLYELKGDKMPIAIHLRMDDFTNHEIQIEKGDKLYLFSDGFADQFGGSKGKKFMYKSFKQLLIDNAQLSMSEQKKVLEKEFENWINFEGNKYEQIDDVTILGIEI